MNRRTSVVLLVLSSFATPALAGVFGFHTVVNPPFTTETALTGHKGYVLSIGTDDGSTIAAVDVRVSGKFHQRWEIDPVTGGLTTTPRSLVTTSGDSHHIIPDHGLIFVTPVENNNLAPSPLADTATRDHGYGNSIVAVWGIPGNLQLSTMALTYLIIPDTDINTLDLTVLAATNPPGPSFYTLRGAQAFGIVPEPAATAVAFVAIIGCGLRKLRGSKT